MSAPDGLSLRGVSKRFAGPTGLVEALAPVDLEVGRGRFVTLIGPSGCGKTTLLRIVAGLLTADLGSVSLFGEPVERARANKRIGFVPQSLGLLPWRTVLANVRLPLEVNRRANRPARDPVAILEAFGLADYLDFRPAQLSGGMRQRVAIARAFAFSPPVLLMDEPFAALDELTREVLRHELLALWQSEQTTVLFVTHSVTEAVLLSDEVVVMSPAPGRIRARIPVDLPRPRGEFIELTEGFRALEREVRLALRGEEAA
ncbi:MAG TPA: ABC transporter ATP-binding protein [Acidimicrobiales bacterium]|nr:ABC transporter ATP-binding protein [Acidimicrobiales bacterium]